MKNFSPSGNIAESAAMKWLVMRSSSLAKCLGTDSNAGAALDLAARERPDAVVLDLSIDGVDGIGILPSLRALLPQARIIVFTGHDDARLRDQAMTAGASSWVLKGSDLSGLMDELGETLPDRSPTP